jgi:hypothetical protein
MTIACRKWEDAVCRTLRQARGRFHTGAASPDFAPFLFLDGQKRRDKPFAACEEVLDSLTITGGWRGPVEPINDRIQIAAGAEESLEFGPSATASRLCLLCGAYPGLTPWAIYIPPLGGAKCFGGNDDSLSGQSLP